MTQRAKYFVVLLYGLIYLAAFFLPAGKNSAVMLGWEAFLSALVLCWCLPMWWANPLSWLAAWFVMKGKPQAAMLMSVLAILLALSQPLMLPADSPDGYGYELLMGYYVWLGSFIWLGVMSTVHAVWQVIAERNGSTVLAH